MEGIGATGSAALELYGLVQFQATAHAEAPRIVQEIGSLALSPNSGHKPMSENQTSRAILSRFRDSRAWTRRGAIDLSICSSVTDHNMKCLCGEFTQIGVKVREPIGLDA
jgi:hypothetical protein